VSHVPSTAHLNRLYKQGRGLEFAPPELPKGALEVSERPIVIFGAGPLGRMTLQHLQRLGVLPVGIADNDRTRWGTTLDGVLIVSAAEAVERYAKSARFVVTIYNGSAVRRELQEKGCSYVSHFADLYFEYATECLPFCGLAAREVILDNWNEVAGGASVWQDSKSVSEYLAQLAWRLRIPKTEMPRHDPASLCYFPTDIFTFLDREQFFDCGAFDGDSLRKYLARRPPKCSPRVWAFEPDAASYARLSEYVKSLADDGIAEIRCEPLAVAEYSGKLRFSALGSVRSEVTPTGETGVSCIALDDIDAEPTLIKMDVEGFELPALKGAAELLRRHRPVLAISLYHHASDLWTIPNYLKSLVPDYHYFLRRYAEDCWELILYAVPVERLLGAASRSPSRQAQL
jgi:FkbM family methyltransferase